MKLVGPEKQTVVQGVTVGVVDAEVTAVLLVATGSA